MKFEKLKPGMVVYDVGSGRLGNTTLRTVRVWEVKIISVDETRREVTASWNTNTPRTYTERSYKQWREKRPMLVGTLMGGYRLANREEIKAARASEATA